MLSNYLAASLGGSASSMFSDRPCVNKQGREQTRKTHQPLASTCTYEHMHTHTPHKKGREEGKQGDGEERMRRKFLHKQGRNMEGKGIQPVQSRDGSVLSRRSSFNGGVLHLESFGCTELPMPLPVISPFWLAQGKPHLKGSEEGTTPSSSTSTASAMVH